MAAMTRSAVVTALVLLGVGVVAGLAFGEFTKGAVIGGFVALLYLSFYRLVAFSRVDRPRPEAGR